MRNWLIILIAFVATTAALIGMLLIAHPVVVAYGFSMEFIQPGVSTNFLLPGVLFIITACLYAAALLAFMQERRSQYNFSLTGGIWLMAWVVIHSVMLQAFIWLYLIYFFFGLLIVLLSWQLKGRWAV